MAKIQTAEIQIRASGLRGVSVLLLGLCFGLTACLHDNVYEAMQKDPVAQNPDHRIVVAPVAEGSPILKAYPPDCPSWREHRPAPLDNMPQPQLGCANQRNLALMIAQPEDLLRGRKLGPADATNAAGTVQRYHEGKVRGLYDPNQMPAAKE